VGAVLTTILAMVLGFGVVLFLALVVYGIAVAALSLLVRASPRFAPDAEAEVPVPAGLTGVATQPDAAPVPGS
jgi:type IV secretory pathway TrbD component